MATSSTKPKPFIFVLMPFAAEFNDVYQAGIKEACKKAGGYCERLDDQIFTENMMDRIYNQIAKADLIVADMTGRNPNVFYEVGYAHALGKTVILLTKEAADIPFDLRHRPHLVYGSSIVLLRDELQKRVRHHLKHPEEASLDELDDLVIYINDESIAGNPTLPLPIHERNYIRYSEGGFPTGRTPQQFLPIRLTVHHCQKSSFEDIYVRLQLITPDAFATCMLVEPGSTTVYNSVKMPANSIAHRPLNRLSVSPGEWEAVDFPISTATGVISKLGPQRFELHLLRSGPPLVFPFTIDVLPMAPVV